MSPQPISPQPGQESVWDYPRPPRLEKVDKSIRILFQGETLAETTGAYRVLETSHPPVYYLPPGDIKMQFLQVASGGSYCEWKGKALYYHLLGAAGLIKNVAWCYPLPTPGFQPIANYIAFYAQPMDGCYVDGEKVTPQPGDFYGGWITANIVGPFKGVPGSSGW
jgi:uncharacterized protein (DUF427 family)